MAIVSADTTSPSALNLYARELGQDVAGRAPGLPGPNCGLFKRPAAASVKRACDSWIDPETRR